MGRFLKWLFGLLILLVVLVVGAAIVLPMVIDPNEYKPQIIEAAEKQLGRDLTIEQDLGLSVFPWLGIETGGVRLGNAAGFAADSFLEVEQVGVRVKLMPLLSQRVEVDTLVLTGLKLNLEKDGDGKTNWADLAGAADAEQPAQEQARAADEQKPPMAVSIQGIRIENARIAWDDRQAGQKYVLDGVRIVTGSLAPGEQVPVEAGVVFTSTAPAMTLDADLQATVATNAEMTAFEIAGLILNLAAEGEGLPSGGADLVLRADVVADTAAGTLSVDRLEFEGPALSATGELAVQGLQTSPVAEGRLAIAETNPKTLASMFAAPIETTDPDALTRAGGEVAFDYADGALKLDPLSLSLDDSTLNGHVHLLDPAGPVVRIKLALDEIDLDRYLPPAREGEAEATPSTASPPAEDPFAALRTLDLQAEFSVGKLKVNNARMSNVTTKVVSRDGVLTMDPMGAELYEGKFDGRVVLNASGKTPKVAARNSLSGIQIGSLLQRRRRAGSPDRQGRTRYSTSTSSGLTEAGDSAQSERHLPFCLHRRRDQRRQYRAGDSPRVSQALGTGRLGRLDTGTPGQTDFTELTGSLQMTNGVIKNQDLKCQIAVAACLRARAPSTCHRTRSITWSRRSWCVRSRGRGVKGRDELSGINIPVRVTGPLTSRATVLTWRPR
jgi:AsmA protein